MRLNVKFAANFFNAFKERILFWSETVSFEFQRIKKSCELEKIKAIWIKFLNYH